MCARPQLIKSMKQALMKQTSEAVKHCAKPLTAASSKKKGPRQVSGKGQPAQHLEAGSAVQSASGGCIRIMFVKYCLEVGVWEMTVPPSGQTSCRRIAEKVANTFLKNTV